MTKKVAKIALAKIVWEPKLYPRQKWNTTTIERYADAMAAGDDFPPLVIDKSTNRLLDGKHRYEAYKLREADKVSVEFHEVPEGMTAKYYAATLSSRHGDRMSNADLKALAEEEFEADDTLDAQEWGKRLGVSKSSVYRWVSHIINRGKASRAAKAWRLSKLGWTQVEIAERLGVSQKQVSNDISNNSHLGKITNIVSDDWNDQGLAEVATRLDLPLTDCWAAMLDGMDDKERLKRLGIKTQPYDVWNFSRCHDLMGDSHPGRIPGELVAHVLYFFTKPGELVIDPMAGSGTTLDACLLMGRKARGYDIDDRHERVDIEECNPREGWPSSVEKASLVFWDPPYFDKMDSANIGDDGYIEGSISGLSPDEYMKWFDNRFGELYEVSKKTTTLAFLMSDWDSQNSNHKDHAGMFVWDYADLLRSANWRIVRQVQCPLPTQQIHPDIVNKFRDSRRLARLNRSLLICTKQ